MTHFFQIVMFDDITGKNAFVDALKEFCDRLNIHPNYSATIPKKEILKSAITKAKRQEILNKFFRVTFRHVSWLTK